MADNEKIPVPPEGADYHYTYQQPTTPLGNENPTTPIGDATGVDPFQPASQTTPFPETTVRATKRKKEKSGRLGNVVSAVIGAVVASALVLALVSFTPLGNRLGSNQGINATTGEITINTSGETTTAEAVAAKCLNSAVTIYVYSNSNSDWSQLFGGSSSSKSTTPSALGSGVIIKEENGTYYIVTNYHVVEGISRAVVKVGDKQYEATAVGSDEKSDLAVISIKGEGLTVAEWGDSSNLNIGEWVAAIGAPYGYEQTLTTGIVSALYRSDTISSTGSIGSTVYTDMIQTDAAINPGNSGGGLFDAEGKLIGINTYISSTSQSSAGLGFAIPQSNAQSIAEQLISGKTVEHAFLGVSMGTATDEGVTVAAVYKDTAAAKAGLQTGDVVTKIGDKAVTSASDVTTAVRAHKVGDKISITFKRDGKEQTVEATLGSDNDASEEYAENGAPAQENSSNGNSNGGNGGNGYGWGNGGSGEDYFGFDLEDLFGGNPFSYGYGDSESGSGSRGGSDNGGSGGNSFWNE